MDKVNPSFVPLKSTDIPPCPMGVSHEKINTERNIKESPELQVRILGHTYTDTVHSKYFVWKVNFINYRIYDSGYYV